jgi:hypothetical protein
MPTLDIDTTSITVTVTTHALAVEAYVAAQTLTLGTGRWLVTLSFSSSPAETAGPSTVVQIDQTLASPGTVNIPETRHWVYRDVENDVDGTLYARLDVQERSGTDWLTWQTSDFDYGVPAAVPNDSFVKGGDLNFIPTTRTQADFDYWIAEYDAINVTRLRVSFTALWLWYGLGTTSAQWGTAPAGGVGSFNAGAVTAFNNFLNACQAAGIEVWCQMQVLHVPVVWGASSTHVLYSGGVSLGPMNQATLDVFIPAFLNEFGDRLYGVCIGNEPNHSDAFVAASHIGPLQQRFYDEVKSHDPTMNVVMGEIAFGDTAYLDEMLDTGAEGKYDAVSFHPYNLSFDHPGHATGIWLNPRHATDLNSDWTQYSQYGLPVTLAEMQKVLADHGDTTSPIWLTEFGFAPAMRNSTRAMQLSDSQAADWLRVEMLQAQADPRVEVVQPFKYDRDATAGSTWVQNFGAHDTSRRPKAMAAVYQELWY